MKRVWLKDDWELEGPEIVGTLKHVQIPGQIHDILLERGIIENPNIRGINQDRWIGEDSWKYKKTFFVDSPEGTWNLKFQGLDTFAEIYLNGHIVGKNRSAYKSLYLENISVAEGENFLEVLIQPPREQPELAEYDQSQGEKIPEFCRARVFRSGFHEFSGPKPDLIRMGIYGQVILEQVEEAGIKEVSIGSRLRKNLTEGILKADLILWGEDERSKLTYQLFAPGGECICKGEKSENLKELEIRVDSPMLWYPRTHGPQNLYRIEIQLWTEDRQQDSYVKTFGFSQIRQKGELDFTVNNLPLKLWGANLAHGDTLTGCYPKIKEKLYGLLDLAEMGNFNCLRIWGEGEVLDDDFYEECDRRGMLLWQDFYMGYGMYREDQETKKLCRKEAEELVKRLKHHPCILLWCGGNEMYWSRDMQYPGEYCQGEEIIAEIYPEVCRTLDPDRYYHINSPSGGDFCNDPLAGDTHGYTHLWYVPGRDYPVFLSENCRVSAPQIKTMRRMMTKEELWPQDYINISTKANPLCWPETWTLHNTNDGALKIGPIEHYHDAGTPEELVYRLGAAHCEYIKKQIERFRRGRPYWEKSDLRRTKGHLLWKFNNNSNIISYGVIDYFNEPLMAYYALKRAYEPFIVSFSIEDFIGVWIVNDTVKTKSGRVQVILLDLEKNKILKERDFGFCCRPDESLLLGSLKEFGQFRKNSVLIARVYDQAGKLLAENTDYTEIERRITFPKKGKLEARTEGRDVVLLTDTFARNVELIGDCDGEQFGWRFADNYFDLIPGVEKRIHIYGNHRYGTIRIKPYYWESGIEVKWKDSARSIAAH